MKFIPLPSLEFRGTELVQLPATDLRYLYELPEDDRIRPGDILYRPGCVAGAYHFYHVEDVKTRSETAGKILQSVRRVRVQKRKIVNELRDTLLELSSLEI